VDKPNARLFAATILVFGLILRGVVTERAQKKAVALSQKAIPYYLVTQ